MAEGSQGRRAGLAAVEAWIEREVQRLGAEPVALAQAQGRVVAADVVAPAPLPPVDRAALDGIALGAAATVGAGAYNPITLRLGTEAHVVAAGDALPAGTDAVATLDQAQRAGATCEIIEAVAPGSQVERAGAQLAAGALVVAAGRRLDAVGLGLLAAAGIAALAVVCRPRVRILLAGPPGTRDSNGPMLGALVARDGGTLEAIRMLGRDRAALARALVAPGADLVLVVGGTGPGADDGAAAALAQAGTLAIHGMALRPGDTAGLGRVDSVPVALLPGAPAACLWAYEMAAGRALRRLAGRPPGLPLPSRRAVTARKLVSAIGLVEICPVALRADGAVEPVAGFAEAGLAAALRADGIVIVPEGREGHAQGSEVVVYLLGS